LSENYAITHTEVLKDHTGRQIGSRNAAFLDALSKYDAVIIGGQAKSHCVAWTISGILEDIKSKYPALAKKVYLVEDFCSPVVVPVPGGDFTDMADEAFRKFVDAGMHVVRSTDAIETWHGVMKQIAA
jgi:nicotinamidase-related amidase